MALHRPEWGARRSDTFYFSVLVQTKTSAAGAFIRRSIHPIPITLQYIKIVLINVVDIELVCIIVYTTCGVRDSSFSSVINFFLIERFLTAHQNRHHLTFSILLFFFSFFIFFSLQINQSKSVRFVERLNRDMSLQSPTSYRRRYDWRGGEYAMYAWAHGQPKMIFSSW